MRKFISGHRNRLAACLAGATLISCAGYLAPSFASAASASPRPAAATPTVLAGGEQYENAKSSEPLHAFVIYAHGTSNAAKGRVDILGVVSTGLRPGAVTCLTVSGTKAVVTYKNHTGGYHVAVVQAGTSPATAKWVIAGGANVKPTSTSGCYTTTQTPEAIYAGAAQVTG